MSRSKTATRNSGETFGLLSTKDLELLKEMGFRRTLAREKKLDLLKNKLRMRQLDQLKMMFFRMDYLESQLFSEEVKKGIRHNDMNAYSDAIDALFESLPLVSKSKGNLKKMNALGNSLAKPIDKTK